MIFTFAPFGTPPIPPPPPQAPFAEPLLKDRSAVVIPPGVGTTTLMTVPAGKVRVLVLRLSADANGSPPFTNSELIVLKVNGLQYIQAFALSNNSDQLIFIPGFYPFAPGDVIDLEIQLVTGIAFPIVAHLSWWEWDTADGFACASVDITTAAATEIIPAPAPGKAHRLLRLSRGNDYPTWTSIQLGGTAVVTNVAFYDGVVDRFFIHGSAVGGVFSQFALDGSNVYVLNAGVSVRASIVSFGVLPTHLLVRALYKIEDL